jgi:tRNA pseudouridine38-40 synthase
VLGDPMRSFRLTLAYDGTCFSGSQTQPKQRTVQGELEQTLGSIGASPSVVIFAGRTDRGVHASGQVVSARLATWRASAEELQRALNARLATDLAVVAADECAASFNPRFDATWREYRYRIAPTIVSPFLRRYAWTPRAAVNAARVAAGAERLVGTHDFASFAGGGEGVPWSDRATRRHGTTRTVFRCECRETAAYPTLSAGPSQSVLDIRVVADGFLPRMVRNIVGALCEVGQGRQEPEWISDLLQVKDRRSGSVVAPPEGLTLWKVGFANDRVEDW